MGTLLSFWRALLLALAPLPHSEEHTELTAGHCVLPKEIMPTFQVYCTTITIIVLYVCVCLTYKVIHVHSVISICKDTYFPMCADCGYPSFPVNGTAALSNTSRGVEVEYSCFTGRAVKGAQSAICLENGNWSAPPPACPCELEYKSHIFD